MGAGAGSGRMRWPHHLLAGFRSLLAVVAAAATVIALNLLGSFLGQGLGLPSGGDPRLAWDLLWLLLAMAAGAAQAGWLAPAAARIHALVLLALVELVAVSGVVQMGSDWPLWFSSIAVLAPPALMLAGIGWRRRPAVQPD